MPKIDLEVAAKQDIDLLVEVGTNREAATKFHHFISSRKKVNNVSQIIAATALMLQSGYSLQEIK